MTAIINGDSPSITFSDATTQATSAVVSGKVPYSILPTGSVLQVVSANFTTYVTSTSASYVASGLTATITPKFATSKILILCTPCFYTTSTGNSTSGNGAIYKNGSSLVANTSVIQGDSVYAGPIVKIAIDYLDSPATTSATTYAFYYANNGGTLAGLNPNGQTSTIILMEIAG